jgi:cell division protein FtsB
VTRTRVILLGAAGAALVGAVSAGSIVRVQAQRAEIAEARRDLGTAREQAARLTQTAERLRSDPAFIEKLAREEQGLVRQDETILKFPPKPR